jgi:nicotinamidase-related amidase
MRPVLDAWIRLIGTARAAGLPIIYTTPVSRADGADVVLLPTDLGARTGVPSLTNCVEGTFEAGFPDEIAPAATDYVFLKRRPSAFYGTGVAELLRMLRRDTIVLAGGATNRGVETSAREAFSMGSTRGRRARVLLEWRRGRPRIQLEPIDGHVRPRADARAVRNDVAVDPTGSARESAVPCRLPEAAAR